MIYTVHILKPVEKNTTIFSHFPHDLGLAQFIVGYSCQTFINGSVTGSTALQRGYRVCLRLRSFQRCPLNNRIQASILL